MHSFDKFHVTAATAGKFSKFAQISMHREYNKPINIFFILKIKKLKGYNSRQELNWIRKYGEYDEALRRGEHWTVQISKNTQASNFHTYIYRLFNPVHNCHDVGRYTNYVRASPTCSISLSLRRKEELIECYRLILIQVYWIQCPWWWWSGPITTKPNAKIIRIWICSHVIRPENCLNHILPTYLPSILADA